MINAKEKPHETPAVPNKPESLALPKKEIKSGRDFINLMSSVMSDLIEGKMTPQVANALCNEAGKLLKALDIHK